MQPVQQLPATHRPPPQMARFGFATSSMQTGLPVAHETTPVMHSPGLPVQLPPAVQVTQPPFTHVPPGQTEPLATLPVSVHTAEPELQTTLPVRHGLAGAQPVPALHGLHEPALHTPPGQVVPFILLLPFAHTLLPDEQSMTPF